MTVRKILVSAVAVAVVAGGVPLVVAPAARALTCPTVNPVTGEVTPRLGPGLNYGGCSFVGATLDAVDLSGANLSRTQWGENSAVQALLVNADLSGAVFLGPVNLTTADLTGANLDKADLADAFVTAAGDTGQLGCGVTGRPVLPTGWRLAHACVKTRGVGIDRAPHPCRAYVSDASTAPITISPGPHALWTKGDLSCGKATAILDDATRNGTVNSNELARLTARALKPSAHGAFVVALSGTESLVVEGTQSGRLLVPYTWGESDPSGFDCSGWLTDSRYQRAADNAEQFLSVPRDAWVDIPGYIVCTRCDTEVTYRQADETGRSVAVSYRSRHIDSDFGRIA